ncbi:helix-turn-helix domain-containing protein [Pedobacter sp. R-06]|uniref:helix-turn-helix domain-containing protein n=1 Tax=Pedobacter sp. R-06 TaxID=3404051 RepID=UPI003CF23B73
MNIEILTKEDLANFGTLLLEEIKKIVAIEEPVKKKFLKGYEVRKVLGVSQGTLQNLRLNGTLPYSKIGSIYYYNAKIVENLMNGNTQVLGAER